MYAMTARRLILSAALIISASCFNLDVQNCVRHKGNPDSLFGFSVAAHVDNGESWLIVGAPEDQTAQVGVTKGGAVYKCDTRRDHSCALIPFDEKEDNTHSDGSKVDIKSNQWFGATVASSNGSVLACAPRYTWYTTTNNRRDPVGTCYLAKNKFSEFSEFSPCRTKNWGYHRQGSCQAGLGATISKSGDRLFIGAPGSWYWQGQLHSVDSEARLPFVPRKVVIIDEGIVYSQNVHKRPDVFSTLEGPPSEDDTYLGYSVTSGDFTGERSPIPDVAVGVPRGAGLLGKIVMYTWNLTHIKNITGEQLGSYFGYSLCSGDIDGDSFDDIIIGAPFYTDLSNNEGKYETGRVYVVYQGKEGFKFSSVHIRDGKNSKARFGLSLTSLGDVNKDGYGDFAVGAPYDGPQEKGAVYIYHGSAKGVREKPSQIIMAEDIAGVPSTFGFSLAGGYDMDNNQYPDLTIGAYESNMAFFVRARPVVSMESSIRFLGESKQIALEERNCTLKDRTKVPCVQLVGCMKYNGEGVGSPLDFEVQFVLDSKKPKSPRLYFLSEEGRNIRNQTLRLERDKQQCKTMFVYLKSNIRDKLTTIDAEMHYSLYSSSSSSRTSRTLHPVLDMDKELVIRDSLTIQKNCGRDNVCIPDLRMISKPNVDIYLLGSGEKLAIEVLVQNEGEDAFESIFELKVPPGLNYVRIIRMDNAEREIPVQCSPPSFLNNNTLRCDIGNPLPKEKLVKFNVILQPYYEEGMKSKYEFIMSVNSTNPEKESSVSDNVILFNVPIWVRTEIELQGSSHPSDIHFNSSQYKSEITQEGEIGPQVVHIYTIQNKGPADFLEAEAIFLWPSFTLEDEHLLYLLEQPETSGNIKCEYVRDVNLENIKIDRKRSYLDSSSASGLIGHETSSSSTSSDVSQSSSFGNRHGHSESFSSSSSSSSSNQSGSRRKETVVTSNEEKDSRGSKIDGKHYSSNGGRLESDSHSRPSTHFHQEEKSSSTNTTWVSGQKPVTVSSSSWKTNDDGVIRQGSHTNTGEGTLNLADLGISSGGSDKKYGWSRERVSVVDEPVKISWSGPVILEEKETKWTGLSQNQPGGKTYKKEYEKSYNSSWSSNKKPVTHVVSKWRTEEDGVVKTGGSSDTYEGTPAPGGQFGSQSRENRREYSGRGEVSGGSSSQGSKIEHSYSREHSGYEATGGRGIDLSIRNQGEVSQGGRVESTVDTHNQPGSKTYKKEYEKSYNSSWSSNKKPITHVSSKWKTEEDGVVKSGSSSDTYEGTPSTIGQNFGTIEQSSGRRTEVDRDEDLASRTSSQGSRVEHSYSREHSGYGGTIRNQGERQGSRVDSESSHGGKIDLSVGLAGSQGGRIEHTFSNRREYGANRGEETGSGHTASRGYSSSGETHSSGRQGSSTYGQASVSETGQGWSSGSDTRKRTNHTTVYTYPTEEKYELVKVKHGDPRISHDGNTGSNVNIADLLGSSSSSGSNNFGGLGEVARGPKDGVAKTYSFDIGTETEKSHGQRNSARNYGFDASSESSRGSSSRTHSLDLGSEASSRGSSSSRTHSLDLGSEGSSRGSSSSRTHSFDLGSEGSSRGSSSARTHSLDLGSEASSRGSSSSRTHSLDLGSEGSSRGSSSSRTHSFDLGSEGSSRGSSSARTHSLDLGSEASSRGSGSRTHDLDLGSDYRSSSRGTHYSSGHSEARGSRTQSFDSGSEVRANSRGSDSASRSSHGSIHYSSGEADRDRDDEDDNGRSGYERHYSSSYSRRYSGSKTEDEPYSGRSISNQKDRDGFRHYSRDKRDVERINCGPVKCTQIKCSLGALKKDQEASVAFRSRLWVPTVRKIASNIELVLSSQSTARVTKLPHIGRPEMETTPTYTQEIKSKIMPSESPAKPEVVPLWIVVLSACAGAIILMLLVYILYKCGFFKRNRPSSAPEKQPLNRNGHYNGDEAL